MNALEITLVVIGIITIIISCILIDRSGSNAGQPVSPVYSLADGITDEDKKKLTQKFNEIIDEISDETIVRTDDALSKLSNEKIIAVNDFSEQILEKIKRNHEEVVFLYDMLNAKEKELKAAVREIDTSKKKVQDILETKVNEEKAQTAQAAKTVKQQPVPKQPPQETAKAIQAEKQQNIPARKNMSTNNNSQILTLYSQGKSVIEISKLLGLGQGEVKLVIDLFKGKK